MKNEIPLALEGISENIYAGFWKRLGAILLDMVILIPYFLLLNFINSINLDAYLYTTIPSLLFSLWFYVYLVKRYGGTPGKLMVGTKIIKMDGSDVDWREAFLRYSVSFIIGVLYTGVVIYGILQLDNEKYQSLDWVDKQTYVFSAAPDFFKGYQWISSIWIYSELLILLLNKRKRALHDYIAGTVVVEKKFISQIREEMAREESI